MEIYHIADSFICMKARSDRDTCRIILLRRIEVNLCTLTHFVLWGPVNSLIYTRIPLFLCSNFWLVLTKRINWYNTHAHTQLCPHSGNQCFHFSRWPCVNIQTQQYRLSLLSISAGGQQVMALKAEHWTLWQKAGLSSKTTQTGPKGKERETNPQREHLKSHLLCVLKRLTLSFFFLSICHPHTFSTHANSLACHSNY